MDMHSGGSRKTGYEMYFIEAENKGDAERIFSSITGENINDVTCECCGRNFSLGGGYDTLEEATAPWRRGDNLMDYITKRKVRVIRNGACPFCGREEEGHWFIPCPSNDCPSNTKTEHGAR